MKEALIIIILAAIIWFLSKPMKCPKCKKGILKKSDLHISERYYIETNVYECDNCQRRFI